MQGFGWIAPLPVCSCQCPRTLVFPVVPDFRMLARVRSHCTLILRCESPEDLSHASAGDGRTLPPVEHTVTTDACDRHALDQSCPPTARWIATPCAVTHVLSWGAIISVRSWQSAQYSYDLQVRPLVLVALHVTGIPLSVRILGD